MASKKSAQKYMNLMAMGLKIVNTISTMMFKQLSAVQNYDQTISFVDQQMNSYWCNDDDAFLNDIENFLQTINQNMDQTCKQIMAIAFCQWLDLRIIYSRNENDLNGERIYFSLYNLVPVTKDTYTIVDSLNTNYKETEIWINPKFPIASPHIIRNKEVFEKNISNRDIFEGINASLNNCSYFYYNNERQVRNIIVPGDFPTSITPSFFTIAFSPMSDRSDLIKVENQIIEQNGAQYCGEAVKAITDSHAQELIERLKNDWILAGDVAADIFFAPELLGTELSESNDGTYNSLIWELSQSRMLEGAKFPLLTILPSYWRDNCNSSTIVSQDGEILGHQEKDIPFVDKKANKMEALIQKSNSSTILIHIPNVHRIAIIICAEFLSAQDWIRKFICGSLGATLIIVPSYSRGEQDFINVLSALKGYGTTIVWGNCCGAVSSSPKAIGGCGIAGTTQTIVFGSKCTCDFTCENIKACVFKIDIPLDFELSKTKEFFQNEIVIHETKPT